MVDKPEPKTKWGRCLKVTKHLAIMPLFMYRNGFGWKRAWSDIWDGLCGLFNVFVVVVASLLAMLTSPITGPIVFLLMERNRAKRLAYLTARRKAMDDDV